MEIHKITQQFSFDELDLEEPKSLQGGSAYSVPIRYKNEVLSVQTEKCTSKNGFVTNGRKTYIDLVFEKDDSNLLNWIESLECRLQNIIFEKSDEWFENSLTSDDIENSFLSLLKPYKNRTKYALRCYVHNMTNFNVGVKIYDEMGNDLTTKDITSDVKIACILSLQDIKFSSKNFQVFINVKQIMVLRDLDKDRMMLLGENNVPKALTNDIVPTVPDTVPALTVPVTVPDTMPAVSALTVPALTVPDTMPAVPDTMPVVSALTVPDTMPAAPTDALTAAPTPDVYDEPLPQDISQSIFSDLPFDNPYYLGESYAGDIELDDIGELDEIMESTSTTQYVELYNKARTKAEIAKKEALQAFFEANNIKKKYNL